MAAAAAPKTAHTNIPIAPQLAPTPPKLLESNTVATQFVQQYYHVLSNWPENLHRFYTDASTLSHSVVGTETVHIQTQRAIHEKVMSLGMKGAVPQILSVDSQTSLGGGVVVHTTGFLTLKGSKPRPFAQVFFLAQQETGYYVLNDMFCWLQKDEKKAEEPAAAALPDSVKEEEKRRNSASEIAPANTTVEVKSEKTADVPPGPQVEEEPTKDQVEPPSLADIDPDAPMTYAQRLKMAAAKRASPSEDAPSAAPPADEPVVSATARESLVQGDDVDSCSIFVRNLPQNVTEDLLLDVFSKLGPVEGGSRGVSLKNVQKGNPYAFIHFQSPQIAARVLGAKVEIEGKQLEIAEKKPSIISKSKKTSNRGQGRGDSRVNGKASGGGRQKPDGSDRRSRGMGKMQHSNGRGQGSGKGQA